MSHNKQVMVRIRIINECLLKGGFWSKQKLINKIAEADINISNRSLDNDIYLMKNCAQLNYNAPIEYSKINKGYYYTHTNYSIDKIPLNEKDIKALTLAATTLGQYKYLPLMQEFTTIIDRVIRVVNRAKQSNHESLLDFIFFEKTPVATGLESVNIIIDAIQINSALIITHQKFSEPKPTKLIVHPYFLKEYRNRWYLIGLSDDKKKIRTYGLDRVLNIELSGKPYIKNSLINPKAFFDNCVGINDAEGKPEKVVLLFTPAEGHYLKTQAIHKSQTILDDCPKNGLLLKYNVIINYEFTGLILGYGSDVKVIIPKSLADKIVEIADRIKSKYN